METDEGQRERKKKRKRWKKGRGGKKGSTSKYVGTTYGMVELVYLTLFALIDCR